MRQPGVVLGLLSDQAGGQNGLELPFLGHECLTSPARTVFALRYDCGLLIAVCYRIGLARWRIQRDPGDSNPRSRQAPLPFRHHGGHRSSIDRYVY